MFIVFYENIVPFSIRAEIKFVFIELFRFVSIGCTYWLSSSFRWSFEVKQ